MILAYDLMRPLYQNLSLDEKLIANDDNESKAADNMFEMNTAFASSQIPGYAAHKDSGTQVNNSTFIQHECE